MSTSAETQRSEFPDPRITPYHAKYFAHELTKRCPSDTLEKIAASLVDAQVDLNPHQVEAALFAFRSPLSKGALLADEVGLGKTIEAGILLSQKWAERKRKLLVIVPSNLRKQWNQELSDKFFLQSVILETKTFNEQIKQRNLNPFSRTEIVICSYQFARSKDSYISQIDWDLVIIDEAHRLRNVYKPSNKIGNALKSALAHCPKVLLTATPLQNSLLELYGLVSLVDEHIFGDVKSFKSQFSRLSTEEDFEALRQRIKPLCQRTLRRQVLEYVSYTNRIALVEEFIPSDLEQKLYNLVSDYLQRPNLYALPRSQRQLMTLILRRLLASSTFAIAGTLEGLAGKLKEAADQQKEVTETPAELPDNLESFDELADEWEEQKDEEDGNDEKGAPRQVLTPEQLKELEQEMQALRGFAEIAKSILKNSKGERLLTALKRGFAETKAKGGSEKAIIFTESTRTQEYLRSILEETAYKGKIVLFNGSNNDLKSKEIYANWVNKHKGTDRVTGSKSADMRAALVEYFRDEAKIMIATEAAAEGVNLQFCSLVINYDLPWNPQRIEQRIGRCHRYGQKHDVVVVNFLNKKNAADQRVYQLLAEKFQLFSGVFGASDEVLGSIESGVDFEKRIAGIYQQCRVEEQIEFSFNQLQQEMEAQIDEKMRLTRQKLLENFDEEVQEKLRMNLKQSREAVTKYDSWLWQLTRFYLAPYARFEESRDEFWLKENPFPAEKIHPGPYRSGKAIGNAPEVRKLKAQWDSAIEKLSKRHPTWTREQCEAFARGQGQGAYTLRDLQLESLYNALVDSGEFLVDLSREETNLYRLGHPLAQRVIEACKSMPLADSEVEFYFSASGKRISILEPFVGKSGFLAATLYSVKAFDAEDHVILAGFSDSGEILDQEQCRRLFSLPAEGRLSHEFAVPDAARDKIAQELERRESDISGTISERCAKQFESEADKLDRWSDDLKVGLEQEIRDLDREIKELRRSAHSAASLVEKLAIQAKARETEALRTRKRKELFEAQDRLDSQRDELIASVQKNLEQRRSSERLFTLRWSLL